MRLMFDTDPSHFWNNAVGYGHATIEIIKALKLLGHEVEEYDSRSDAPVAIHFCQPDLANIRDEPLPNGKMQYSIQYTPWESDNVPASWHQHINGWTLEDGRSFRGPDELWVPSQMTKTWFENLGWSVDYVFQHGIDHEWAPRHRKRKNVLKFLIVGEPGVRRLGQWGFDAFKDVFGDSKDVHLTIKGHGGTTIRDKDRFGSIIRPMSAIPNVTVINETLSATQMIWMFRYHDVLIYPSSGEGFGFIPLQALATGMPTICTAAWAPYQEYLGPLALDSKVGDTLWPEEHPGKVFLPDKQQLREYLKECYVNFQDLSDYYYEQAPAVHEAYDWTNLTRKAVAQIQSSLDKIV